VSDLIRLTAHPADENVVVLDVPQHLNPRMRQLPARLSTELHGFLLHVDALPALANWARHNHVHVADDRGVHGKQPTPTAGSRRSAPECASCAQPAPMSRPTKVCPACGEPWKPVVFRLSNNEASRTACPSCKHEQTGRFAFCERCGTRMAYDKPVPRFTTQREHLDQPQSLGDALADLAAVMPKAIEPPAEPEGDDLFTDDDGVTVNRETGEIL
jgi:hypothetical protein